VKVAFIIGSPRSGTTILENTLSCHPEIAEWYEPYYLWGKYFSSKEDSVWMETKLNERTKRAIHREFRIFSKKAKKPIVIDKSPGHAFNIKVIKNIFPEAKWIHILRDGRDVTLSIKKEWEKRRQIVEEKDFIAFFRTALSMLRMQPFLRYRLMAVIFELRSSASLNPLKYLNKSKWSGNVGWGPRFKGWKEYYRTHSSLEYNATQWRKSVEAVRASWSILPEKDKIEVRYENLLMFPEETLVEILKVLGVEASIAFFERIPKLESANFNKWAKEFTAPEIEIIKPILAPMIHELGYAHPAEW
jgi:hypothetical protein